MFLHLGKCVNFRSTYFRSYLPALLDDHIDAIIKCICISTFMIEICHLCLRRTSYPILMRGSTWASWAVSVITFFSSCPFLSIHVISSSSHYSPPCSGRKSLVNLSRNNLSINFVLMVSFGMQIWIFSGIPICPSSFILFTPTHHPPFSSHSQFFSSLSSPHFPSKLLLSFLPATEKEKENFPFSVPPHLTIACPLQRSKNQNMSPLFVHCCCSVLFQMKNRLVLHVSVPPHSVRPPADLQM